MINGNREVDAYALLRGEILGWSVDDEAGEVAFYLPGDGATLAGLSVPRCFFATAADPLSGARCCW
jgi:hypothetical protein